MDTAQRVRELLDNAAEASDALAIAMRNLAYMVDRDIPRLYNQLQDIAIALQTELETLAERNGSMNTSDAPVTRET